MIEEGSGEPFQAAHQEDHAADSMDQIEPLEGTADSKNTTEMIPTENKDDSPPEEEKKQTIMQAARSEALRPFVIISTSYLLFTVTDGAIRMM